MAGTTTKRTTKPTTKVTQPEPQHEPAVTQQDAPPKAVRAATCGEWVTIHSDDPAAEGRDINCKRLPRHHGECRAAKPKGLMSVAERARVTATTRTSRKAKTSRATTLATIGAVVRQARQVAGHTRGRLSSTQKRAAITFVIDQVSAGRLDASIALGATAKLA